MRRSSRADRDYGGAVDVRKVGWGTAEQAKTVERRTTRKGTKSTKKHESNRCRSRVVEQRYRCLFTRTAARDATLRPWRCQSKEGSLRDELSLHRLDSRRASSTRISSAAHRRRARRSAVRVSRQPPAIRLTGLSIGFIADNQIERVELSGGQPRTIAPAGTRVAQPGVRTVLRSAFRRPMTSAGMARRFSFVILRGTLVHP